MILVADPKTLKQIQIRQFSSFIDRASPSLLPYPLSLNLLQLDGTTWKRIRSISTPVFTSGKLRHVFPLISAVGNEISDKLQYAMDNDEHVDIRK